VARVLTVTANVCIPALPPIDATIGIKKARTTICSIVAPNKLIQYVAKNVAPTFKIPNGELYTRLESGKGGIGVFIQGNNEVTPWRFKIRAADLNNLQILPHILKGAKIADIMAILGSIDVIMGSVDR